MRQTGSRNTLVKIDYDMIGDLAGVAGDTAKQYAHRGEYDPRALNSMVTWVNSRRKRQGLPVVGVPADQLVVAEFQVKHESDTFKRPAAPPLDSSGGYDPLLGGYRTDSAFRRESWRDNRRRRWVGGRPGDAADGRKKLKKNRIIPAHQRGKPGKTRQKRDFRSESFARVRTREGSGKLCVQARSDLD